MNRSAVIQPAAPVGRRDRAARALRTRQNWVQLAQFGAVGATGYAVNLAVYAVLLHAAGLHFLAAATISFLVAAANNYVWNRLWTFRGERGRIHTQGARFLAVSLAAYAANLVVLTALVAAGLDKLPAQAVAIALVTPVNFLGNKLWSFRRG